MKQRNHNHKETRARARKGRAGAHAAQDKAATGKATTPPATHDRDRRAELTVKATSNGNAQPIEGDTVTADGPTAEQPAPPDERREQQAEQPAAAKKTAKQRPKRRRKQRMPKRRAPAAPAKPKPTLNHEATDDPAATTRPEVGSSHGSGAQRCSAVA